jgi:hydroxymethylglutaryl-CoA lyase
MPDHVTLFEMGPRDGLQNESRAIPTADKIRLVDLLSQTGLTCIEVTSFVSPNWVPQMADAAAVMAGITRAPGVIYAVLPRICRGLRRR